MTTKLTCIFLCLLSIFIFGNAARLVEDQAPALTYHKGALLTGRISINLIFYGKFTAAQKSIVADFITSLSVPNKKHHKSQPEPSVSKWWHTLSNYYNTTSTPFPRITLGSQHSLDSNAQVQALVDSDIANLAALGPRGYAVNVVLTAPDIAVEKFCMSRCGSHSASRKSKTGGRFAYIWVGNSATQCPGQCAWPFHQPIYGSQVPPLVAPNGDVGMDGLVINLAALLAGTFTNPFGNGYFQGDKEAPLEAVTACPGVYGKGAYPGYAGDLLIDEFTGGSYNANGVNARKYLLPAVFDPATLSCSTLV